MRALVTGGAGFIGSHLVEYLLEDGHHVVVLDNFSTIKKENLDILKNGNDLAIFEADIMDFKSIQSYFKNVDWVFHLAGLAGEKSLKENPLEYYRINVQGTINALEASRMGNVKKFIYANTSSCYGIPKVCPIPETADINLRSPYALSKYLGELCSLNWAKTYNLAAVSLRLFKVYGPRTTLSAVSGGLFGGFLEKRLRGEPLEVYGDGNQTKDFVYVSDVVSAFLLAAKSGVNSETFNIGSGKSHSVNYLAELFGGPVKHVYQEREEPCVIQADITRAKKMLKWLPKVSLEEGVQKLLSAIENSSLTK